jgi:hypothetical protein
VDITEIAYLYTFYSKEWKNFGEHLFHAARRLERRKESTAYLASPGAGLIRPRRLGPYVPLMNKGDAYPKEFTEQLANASYDAR